MWAARSGGAKQRVADAQARLAAENEHLPESERAAYVTTKFAVVAPR